MTRDPPRGAPPPFFLPKNIVSSQTYLSHETTATISPPADKAASGLLRASEASLSDHAADSLRHNCDIIAENGRVHATECSSTAQVLVSSHRREDDPMTVFVGRLPPTVPDYVIYTLLEQCGKILEWKRAVGKSFGFCQYAQPNYARRCLELMNGVKLDCQPVLVKLDNKELARLVELAVSEQDAAQDKITKERLTSIIEQQHLRVHAGEGEVRASAKRQRCKHGAEEEGGCGSGCGSRKELLTGGWDPSSSLSGIQKSTAHDLLVLGELERFRTTEAERGRLQEKHRLLELRHRAEEQERLDFRQKERKNETVDCILREAKMKVPNCAAEEMREISKSKARDGCEEASGCCCLNDEKIGSNDVTGAELLTCHSHGSQCLQKRDGQRTVDFPGILREVDTCVMLDVGESNMRTSYDTKPPAADELGPLKKNTEQKQAKNDQRWSKDASSNASRHCGAKIRKFKSLCERQMRLVSKIPQDRKALFMYPVDWVAVDKNSLVSSKLRAWVASKVIELLGEEENTVIEFICSKLTSHCHPNKLLAELRLVFDDEADIFIEKLWRILIYYTIECQ